jgi:hypothetical protein
MRWASEISLTSLADIDIFTATHLVYSYFRALTRGCTFHDTVDVRRSCTSTNYIPRFSGDLVHFSGLTSFIFFAIRFIWRACIRALQRFIFSGIFSGFASAFQYTSIFLFSVHDFFATRVGEVEGLRPVCQ